MRVVRDDVVRLPHVPTRHVLNGRKRHLFEMKREFVLDRLLALIAGREFVLLKMAEHSGLEEEDPNLVAAGTALLEIEHRAETRRHATSSYFALADCGFTLPLTE